MKLDGHYIGVFKRGEAPSILNIAAGPSAVPSAVADPENPPPGLGLAAAVDVAFKLRKPLRRLRLKAVVLSRQSTGAYVPVAVVSGQKAVTLLFDPGNPRLTITREGLEILSRMGMAGMAEMA